MATTELLTDPGHVRQDLQLMTQAVDRSAKHPEIPIPSAVIAALAKVAGTILLKGKPRDQLQQRTKKESYWMPTKDQLGPDRGLQGEKAKGNNK